MITITDFKARTAAQIKAQLPIDVTSDGQPLFTANAATFTVPTQSSSTTTAPAATTTPAGSYKATRDQLTQLVLRARNDANSGDSAHVSSAQGVVDAWTPSVTKNTDGSFTATRDQLTKLVLNAQNDNGSDSAHVASAQKTVDDWATATFGSTTSSSSTPTSSTSTSSTSTSSTSNSTTTAPTQITVSKPNWLGGWSGNVGDTVRSIISGNGSTTSLFVAYNIPHRDNGNYSAGGLQTATEYHNWIKQIADAISTNKAIVVLEPDALGLAPGLASDAQRTERTNMLKDAVATLKVNANTKVYMDLSMWLGVDNASTAIKQITGIDGFSINVSGFKPMQECTDFGNAVSAKTGLHYVIDTSRNGNGEPHPGKWCNQTDTKIGAANTTQPSSIIDFYLWIKVPGESDGLGINDDGSHPRNDVPSAGTLWPEYRDAIYSGNWTSFKSKYGV